MRVGFGKSQITPHGGKIVIAGNIPVRYTDEVHDDVYAVAMVLEQNNTRTIWVSCDMCHPTKKLTDDVLVSLKETLPDFKDEELILSTTHSTACFYLTDDEFLNSAFDVDLSEMLPIEDARRQVCMGIVSAVVKAVSDMTECTVEFATSEILTGYCRRVVYKDGTAIMYGDVKRDDFLRMEYPDSSGIQIIYFYSKDKHKLSGIFAAVPCPAQADEHSVYITADYWGVVREKIEHEFGNDVVLVGVCRSAGELSPHRLMSVEANSVECEWGRAVAERLGSNIARAIVMEQRNPLRVFDSNEISYSRITTEIAFPVRKPTHKELEDANEYFNKLSDSDGNGETFDWQQKARATHCVNVVDKDDYYNGRVSVMKLGELLFFTTPAELFAEYSKRIAARFPDNPVLDVQLTNDSIGYLPTAEAVEHGGYSTDIFSTVTTPDGGEKLVDEIIGLLKSLIGENERE